MMKSDRFATELLKNDDELSIDIIFSKTAGSKKNSKNVSFKAHNNKDTNARLPSK